ncbi:hypothetical protein [Xanthomonas sacchari]|uniref:hypothetical protein n=1 Tax=Xanthomonas sacchari TaxID=56458 RepID=UPI0022534034|nr:hypothetical protein [Xanthomonas sacchari]
MKFLSFIIAVFLISGCTKSGSKSEYFGLWVSKKSNSETRELRLGEDMNFEARGVPAEIFCSNSEVAGDIDGVGTWEYEAENDRVFLKFSRMTNNSCATPYGVMIFPQPGKKLAAFYDVEKPSGAVIFNLADAGKNN